VKFSRFPLSTPVTKEFTGFLVFIPDVIIVRIPEYFSFIKMKQVMDDLFLSPGEGIQAGKENLLPRKFTG